MINLSAVKEMKIDVPSLLLGSAAGVLAGGGATYLVLRRTMERRFNHHLDMEVAEVKRYYGEEVAGIKAEYNGRVKAALSDLSDTGHPFVGEPHERSVVASGSGDEDDGEAALGTAEPDPAEGLDDGADDGDPDAEGEDEEADQLDEAGDDVQPDQAVHAPLRRDINRPYVISAEEFGETPPGWQQLTITYFAKDKVLVDDKNEPIQLINKTTGPLSPLSFGGVSGDAHLCYVRNQLLEIDFEIVLDRRAYADVILHYGNPNRGS